VRRYGAEVRAETSVAAHCLHLQSNMEDSFISGLNRLFAR